MFNENTIYKLTAKGAMLLALCDTFGCDNVTTEQVDKCYKAFIMYLTPKEEDNAE